MVSLERGQSLLYIIRLNIRIVSGKLCGDSFRNDFGNFAYAVPEGGTDTLC